MEKSARPGIKVVVCLILGILLGGASLSYGWTGRVVDVMEGDTLVVAVGGNNQTIKLYGIDCPERGQPLFDNARVLMAHLTTQKMVEVLPVYTDSDQVVNALVRLDGVAEYLNGQLISYGMAWVRPDICKSKPCEEWRRLELMARQKGIGLWAQMNPVPPWEYKIQQRMKIREGVQGRPAEPR